MDSLTTLPRFIRIRIESDGKYVCFSKIGYHQGDVVMVGKRYRRIIDTTSSHLPVANVSGISIIPEKHFQKALRENEYYFQGVDCLFKKHDTNYNLEVHYVDDTVYYYVATRDIQVREELIVLTSSLYIDLSKTP